AAINVRAAISSPFASNVLPFQVEALPPLVDSVAPGSATAGIAGTTLTVNGARFAADSQVLWDGAPVPTTFVNSSKLTAQIDAARLALGGEVGVSVRNPTPHAETSNVQPFVIEPEGTSPQVFLPLVMQ
ncbi:MAG: IPT/TIG domain-containing protein, partial [Caldilineaceae bacterium]|nr:IPT/TIG domain-containing protein [Caldilineaceae bacterium]